MSERILFVPECEAGKGSGHMIRSLKLAAALRAELYLPLSAFKARPLYDDPYAFAEAIDSRWARPEWRDAVHTRLPEASFTKLVFDVPDLSYRRMQAFRGEMTIGLDCGGEARSSLSYLIDTLPNFYGDANTASIGFQLLPEERRNSWPKLPRKVLVSLGGEDLSGRSAIARAAIEARHPDLDIESSAGLFRRDDQSCIRDLRAYDLVVTHFGLLSYESLWTRVPVLLVNPTRYHERLARRAGFVSFFWGKNFPDLSIEELFPELLRRSKELCPRQKKDLAKLIRSLRPFRGLSGPARAVARFSDRSFFRTNAGGVKLAHYFHEEKTYETSYFFEEYKKQYGRSYQEDASVIYALGKKRLAHIRPLRPGGRLLDLGCAYGHFLRVARDSGYESYGVDISEAATSYVGEELGFPVQRCDLRNFDPSAAFPEAYFDVVSLWYVLEHMQNPLDIVDSLLPILKPRGVLCFSAPSLAGVSARFSTRHFFETSPVDHFVLWNPWQLKDIFRPLGLKLRRWVSTGHHPERVPLPLAQSSLGRVVYKNLSRVLRMGDTFEAYFVKEYR